MEGDASSSSRRSPFTVNSIIVRLQQSGPSLCGPGERVVRAPGKPGQRRFLPTGVSRTNNMYKRYPSVQSMSAFIQAARSGSFSSAARKLDLTHSAISQQIRSLEEFIGQPLFVREGGGS